MRRGNAPQDSRSVYGETRIEPVIFKNRIDILVPFLCVFLISCSVTSQQARSGPGKEGMTSSETEVSDASIVSTLTPKTSKEDKSAARADLDERNTVFAAPADALFDFEKAVLTPSGKDKLDDLAAKLQGSNLEVVVALGYSERVGSDKYNERLALRRAQAVKAYLVSKGIEGNRIYTEGKGKRNPITTGCTQKNRKELIKCLASQNNVEVSGRTASPLPTTGRINQFPSPVPMPSAMSFPISLAFAKPAADREMTFGDVQTSLNGLLQAAGYGALSYYQYKGGFAFVTRLEKTRNDWTPLPPPERWAVKDVGMQQFSLLEYLRRLFNASNGHYQILVFLITSEPVLVAEKPVTFDELNRQLPPSADRLPSSFSSQKVPDRTFCTVLIYEFLKADAQDAAVQWPGQLDAKGHLQKASLSTALRLSP
jgi:outer membrane protein OmpA-like peptidoglycan-associated protein